jgi:hypothetical protein
VVGRCGGGEGGPAAVLSAAEVAWRRRVGRLGAGRAGPAALCGNCCGAGPGASWVQGQERAGAMLGAGWAWTGGRRKVRARVADAVLGGRGDVERARGSG